MKEGKKELSERQESLGIRILQNCRNELYSLFPHLDGAFASLSYCLEEEIEGIGTDGEAIFFSPLFLMGVYVESPAAVRRGYLHMLLHCLYLHIFRKDHYEKRQWNLACDLAVELIIEGTGQRSLEILTNSVQTECLTMLGGRSLSAEQIYRMLDGGEIPFPLGEMEEAFGFDDHILWDRPRDSIRENALRKKWEKVRSYTGQSHRRQGVGRRPGTDVEEVEELRRSRYDYRKFLRRFTIPREEVELDTESFDYIFYNLGMEHYGNMPLIEPLEYREVNRLEELVIAIDTSHSCSVETVQRFLEETYGIFSQKENFFRRMKVYIIQCDCTIHDVAVIHSEEEWKDYSKRVRIYGRSGTDFCPVFRYVEKLREENELRNLKALIYFTDGDGVYPRVGPDYETAFVFLKGHAHMELAPPWAIRLLVE